MPVYGQFNCRPLLSANCGHKARGSAQAKAVFASVGVCAQYAPGLVSVPIDAANFRVHLDVLPLHRDGRLEQPVPRRRLHGHLIVRVVLGTGTEIDCAIRVLVG